MLRRILIVCCFLTASLLIAPLKEKPSAEAQDRGCSISRFDVNPSGTVYMGTWVSLYGESSCGTTKFTVGGADKAETGQPNNSETWKTEEFGAGDWEVCFVARGNGGWENADRWCQYVTVISDSESPSGDDYYDDNEAEDDYSGDVGSNDESSGEPPIEIDPNDSQVTITTETYGDSSDSLDCGSSLPEPVKIGDRAEVTPGLPNNLRSQPSTNSTKVGQIPSGGKFTVTDGPRCGSGVRWWYVRADNGQEGWTADGTSSEYWIASLDGSPASEATTLIVFEIWYAPFDYYYIFQLDPRSCLIVNGADVVALELTRFSVWMDEKNFADQYASAIKYFLPTIKEGFKGDIEKFRNFIEDQLTSNSGCSSLKYLVGLNDMDTSGLGNIIFGYFSTRYPQLLEDFISDGEQAFNSESWGSWGDNPDDKSQRRVGRAIAEANKTSKTVHPALVEQKAAEVNLK